MQGKVIGVHGRVRAQCTGDDRAVGVDAGLVGRNLAGVHELLHIGVVAGHADERALVEQVGARVAHVGDGERIVFDVGAGCRATHAGFAQAVERGLDHGGVGCLDGCGQSRGVRGLRRRLGDGLDGDGGCHLAGGVSAHAVAHAKERRLHQIGVLVMRTHAADIGAGAPHELRGGAGIVGRVGLNALVGQRLKTHGRARVFELGLHGGNVNLSCIAGRDGGGIVVRVGDGGRGSLFGCTVGGLVVLRSDGCGLGGREVRGRGRAVELGDILRRCGGHVLGRRLHGLGRQCVLGGGRRYGCRCGCGCRRGLGLGCRLGRRSYGEHRCRGLGSRKHGSTLVDRFGDGLGKVSRRGR